MSSAYFVDRDFTSIHFLEAPLQAGEYEQCNFESCNMANAPLGNFQFIDCVFTNCDLSLANLSQTALRNVQFRHCKLVGVHFETCNPFLFEVHIEHSNLQLASFEGMKMKQAGFKNCQLLETDFTKADCTKAVFADCDFAGAIFDATILEQADFRTSYNYTIDPDSNRIRKAKFSMEGLEGLLQKYQIVID
ncbi:MAG TPA: pentapeptide repeat-containing protein [Phnomibacter sp.]|nr:pentapeptide repeat-containing protein [Phnomibacter sp.]